MKDRRSTHQSASPRSNTGKRQFQLQLLAIALAGAGGLLSYLGFSAPVSGSLLLAGLATLFLTPRT